MSRSRLGRFSQAGVGTRAPLGGEDSIQRRGTACAAAVEIIELLPELSFEVAFMLRLGLRSTDHVPAQHSQAFQLARCRWIGPLLAEHPTSESRKPEFGIDASAIAQIFMHAIGEALLEGGNRVDWSVFPGRIHWVGAPHGS